MNSSQSQPCADGDNAARTEAKPAAAFTLDTSGCVRLKREDAPWKGLPKPDIYWSDLDPFTQGYVDAMLRPREATYHSLTDRFAGFSDLAPETLAAILKDCERFARSYPGRSGAMFWRQRNVRGYFGERFPPLTPYLGDDGRVYLREGASA